MHSTCKFSFKMTLLVLAMCWNIQAQKLKVTLLGTGSPIPVIERLVRVLWSKQDRRSC